MPTSSDTNLMSDLPPTDGEFEELAIAEEELIDAYLRNELSADERKLFANALHGSSELRERLHFASLLLKEVSSTPQPQTLVSQIDHSSHPSEVAFRSLRKWRHFFGPSFMPKPAFRLALAACVVLILLGGAALLAGWMNLRRESQRLAAERTTLEQQQQALEKSAAEQQSRSAQLTAEILTERQQLEDDRKRLELRRVQIAGEQTSSRTSVATLAHLFLPPGLTRGAGPPKELRIQPGVAKIKLELGLEAVDYARYQALIKTARNVELYQQRNLKPTRSSKAVALKVSASSLPAGDYTVYLSGTTSSGATEVVGEYSFRVIRKQE